MRRTTVLAAFVLIGVAAVRGADAPADAADPIGIDSSLGDLVERVEALHPAVLAARQRHAAALARVPQARAFPDPSLRVALAAVPIETRVGPQQAQLSLGQTLPWAGKREARAAEAGAAAEAARVDWERERRRVAFEVEAIWYDLYALARAVEITRDNRDLLVYVEEIVRKAYEIGRVPYADLIRSQVEIGKVETELLALADRRVALEERMNAQLRRPRGSPLPEPTLPQAEPTLPPRELLRARVRERAPDVELLEAERARAERVAHVARLARRPDWNVSLNWFPTGPALNPATPDSGDDPIYGAVTVALPLGRAKYEAHEREAAERQAAATHAREAAEEQARARLESLFYEFDNAQRELRLYHDTLIPKAEQSLEASQAGLRTGAVGVIEIVDAVRLLLQFNLTYEHARAEREKAAAEIRFLLGGEFHEVPVAEAAP